MILAAMNEILEKISEIVNQCLGPLGSEGFTWNTIRDFLIQLGATLILFIVVRIFLWKPITNILETRRAAIDQELEQAKTSNEAAKKLELEIKEQYSIAQIEIKQMLDKAEKDSNARREIIINEAKNEAKRRLENLEVEIDQEINKKNKEIRQAIVDIAFSAAQKIIASEIDQEKYLTIVNEIIEGAKQ